jgi:probable rRNA maturation factor
MHDILVDIAFEPECLAAAAQASSDLVKAAIVGTVSAFAPEGAYEVSVMLMDDESIRKLNAGYRGKDVHTDVLSFPQMEGEDSDFGPGLPSMLGDIAISVETAERQAEEFGHPLERELAYLAVHGTLHLLGYDHDDEPGKAEMRLAEEFVLFAMKLSRE